MDKNYDDYNEMAQDAWRALEREREEMMERAELLNAHLRVLDEINEVSIAFPLSQLPYKS